jgi:hypothetical protein
MADKDVIVIPMTEDSPEVRLDQKNWTIRIFGPSFPEDPVEFYSQILKWIDINQNRFDKIVVEFDYSILSSASNKMVFELFIKFEELIQKGKEVIVKWYYDKYDEDMYDEGRSFKNSMKVPVELIEKNDE